MSGIIGGAGSKSGIIGHTELDYEGGTFDPIPMAASTAINNSSLGRYIKIGKSVTIIMQVNSDRGSGVVGPFSTTGLPFTLDTAYSSAASFRGNDFVNLNRVSASVATGGVYFYYEPHSISAGLANIQAEDLLRVGTSNFVVEVTYKSA